MPWRAAAPARNGKTRLPGGKGVSRGVGGRCRRGGGTGLRGWLNGYRAPLPECFYIISANVRGRCPAWGFPAGLFHPAGQGDVTPECSSRLPPRRVGSGGQGLGDGGLRGVPTPRVPPGDLGRPFCQPDAVEDGGGRVFACWRGRKVRIAQDL